MQTYMVTAHSAAQPRTVYCLLIDGESWPKWMHVDKVSSERSRQREGPDQVGDVREIRTGRYVNHEKIVDLVPDRSFRYIILDGVLGDYEGNVTLTVSAGGGTKISWQGSFRMSMPGAAWFMKLYLTCFMKRAVIDLARFAEDIERNGSL